jgi:hypothetical protein
MLSQAEKDLDQQNEKARIKSIALSFFRGGGVVFVMK